MGPAGLAVPVRGDEGDLGTSGLPGHKGQTGAHGPNGQVGFSGLRGPQGKLGKYGNNIIRNHSQSQLLKSKVLSVCMKESCPIQSQSHRF